MFHIFVYTVTKGGNVSDPPPPGCPLSCPAVRQVEGGGGQKAKGSKNITALDSSVWGGPPDCFPMQAGQFRLPNSVVQLIKTVPVGKHKDFG